MNGQIILSPLPHLAILSKIRVEQTLRIQTSMLQYGLVGPQKMVEGLLLSEDVVLVDEMLIVPQIKQELGELRLSEEERTGVDSEKVLSEEQMNIVG